MRVPVKRHGALGYGRRRPMDLRTFMQVSYQWQGLRLSP